MKPRLVELLPKTVVEEHKETHELHQDPHPIVEFLPELLEEQDVSYRPSLQSEWQPPPFLFVVLSRREELQMIRRI